MDQFMYNFVLLDIKGFCKPHTVPDFQKTLYQMCGWNMKNRNYGRLLERSGNFSGNSE